MPGIRAGDYRRGERTVTGNGAEDPRQDKKCGTPSR